MTNDDLTRLAKSLDKEHFLKFIYIVITIHPQWVEDAIKAINAAIKDKWIEK